MEAHLHFLTCISSTVLFAQCPMPHVLEGEMVLYSNKTLYACLLILSTAVCYLMTAKANFATS